MAGEKRLFRGERASRPMRVLRVLVERDDVVYLQSLIEAYDGMAFTQTVDPDSHLEPEGEGLSPGSLALVQLFTSPEFLPEVRDLLHALK
ncbi:MAG: hypothetical protein ACE5LX_09640, partial [Nitrospinota bacterium]